MSQFAVDIQNAIFGQHNVRPINGRSRAPAAFGRQKLYPRLRSVALAGYAAPPDGLSAFLHGQSTCRSKRVCCDRRVPLAWHEFNQKEAKRGKRRHPRCDMSALWKIDTRENHDVRWRSGCFLPKLSKELYDGRERWKLSASSALKLLTMNPTDVDPYSVLEVPSTASIEEIKSAFRRLAKRYHPDAGGTHEQMLRLLAAWQVLSDPSRRAAYDSSRASPDDEAARKQWDTVSEEVEREAQSYPSDPNRVADWVEELLRTAVDQPATRFWRSDAGQRT